MLALYGALLAFSPASLLSTHLSRRHSPHTRSCALASSEERERGWRAIARPRCRLSAFETGEEKPELSEMQMEQIFQQFDTSADGFIDLTELQAALAKAGRPISSAEAEQILQRVDANDDGQISLDEFKAVFKLSPGSVPDSLNALLEVRSFFVDGLSRVGNALGIEASGQWRTSSNGQRFVDDVIGDGKAVLPGDVVQLHYTITLMSTNNVVETSRGGLPVAIQVGEATGAGRGWNDALSGMRVGGIRRVYALPEEGEGATARYDVEVMGVDESASSKEEGIIASLGGRRAITRLLFALTFVPYFLPSDKWPAWFSSPSNTSPLNPPDEVLKQDPTDVYVSKELDAIFSQEVLPKGSRRDGARKE
uniref:peptidylprolyl isomerase n=1 Tax=Coccolithus braarudii TaxID=221442 RepID=A0A7S0L3X7_9EUKA